MSSLQDAKARTRRWWQELPTREQRLVGIAGVLVVVALVWWIALAPALRTIANARASHAQLDLQLQQMRSLQVQARTLQALPRANRDDALRALETSVSEALGGSVRQTSGGAAAEGVLVTLRATPATSLAQWLTQARGNARALPREIHITRSQSAPATGASSGTGAASTSFSGLPPGIVIPPGGRPPPPGGPVSGAGRTGTLPAGGHAPAASTGAEALGARWDGTLVMSLPAR